MAPRLLGSYCYFRISMELLLAGRTALGRKIIWQIWGLRRRPEC
jgi:hypothetical protein